MDYFKPTLIVISGPNGAGKSTHIQTMLPAEFAGLASFDRDQARVAFEQQLKQANIPADEILPKATRLMEDLLVQEMKLAISNKAHFVLETPLSHPDYWQYIDLFERHGYQVQLNYLCLDKVSDCIARVGQRVLEGGHYVDPRTIKGVYTQNLDYINQYAGTFEIIELYDGMKVPTLLAKLDKSEVLYVTEQSLQKSWIKAGLPIIARRISMWLKSQK